MMKISRTLSVLGVVSALAVAAHADVKVVQAVTIENPQLKAAIQSMSPEQRAQMAKMGLGGTIVSTVYISGKKSRTDVGPATSVIVDQASGKVTTLNRISHTYSTQPLSRSVNQAKNVQSTVKSTGRTKVILGHLCRDYRVSLLSAVGGASMKISGDIWAAPDLPRPAIAGAGPLGALQGQWSKMSGMPLLTTLTSTGSAAGATTIRVAAQSVSKTPIPASTFTVPSGYKLGPAYASPMMGGGMGAGQ